MVEGPLSVEEMLRRALKAQLEMGLGDMVINRNQRLPEPSAFETAMEKQAVVMPELFSEQPDQGNIFGMKKTGIDIQSALGEAMYESVGEHYASINKCLLCPLGETRNKFVYGVGNPQTKLVFIGEAPGAKEDLLGEPFVGAAGQLLDKILAAIQFTRKDIYIANILKCRPPNNRDPLPAEVEKCLPYLHEQLRLIKPKLLCCLGRIAAQTLLNTNAPLNKLRNQWHDYHGIPMIVTFHPAALLRNPNQKRDAWEDMKTLKARYDQLI
jgi:uracil-DNA glycosylase family 4